MRVKKTINLGIVSWSNNKFFEKRYKNCMVDSKENYKFGLGVKGLRSCIVISINLLHGGGGPQVGEATHLAMVRK